jgi:tetratricopeptide (TPR) repeat protein
VRALQPGSAAAWYNEGTALEALGRTAEARARYRDALLRDAHYSPALNNLGALDLRDGRVVEARQAFELAVRGDPGNADAHANLGLVLIATADAELGLASIARALAQKPQLLGGLMPHAWLLAAHADPLRRRPEAALDLAQRILLVSPDRAGALDLLAACLAATGDFARAADTAAAAVSAAAASADLPAIRERLALYQRRQPFVLRQ